MSKSVLRILIVRIPLDKFVKCIASYCSKNLSASFSNFKAVKRLLMLLMAINLLELVSFFVKETISLSLVVAARAELREVEPFPRRRMSDSDLSLKSVENGVKLSYQEWLGLQRMEVTAAAGEKRIELLEEELKKHSSMQSQVGEFRGLEASKYVSKYLETSEAWSDSGTTDNRNVTDVSSFADPSEFRTEERGRKSRTKLPLLCYVVSQKDSIIRFEKSLKSLSYKFFFNFQQNLGI